MMAKGPAMPRNAKQAHRRNGLGENDRVLGGARLPVRLRQPTRLFQESPECWAFPGGARAPHPAPEAAGAPTSPLKGTGRCARIELLRQLGNSP